MDRIHKIKFEGQTQEFVINDANEDAENAFAYGDNAKASAPASSAFGIGTEASTEGAHVIGKYNLIDNESKYLHIIGNGTNTIRSNAHTVDKEGNGWFAGNVIGTIGSKQISLSELKQLCTDLNNYIVKVEESFTTEVLKGIGLDCKEENGIISFKISIKEDQEENISF